MSLHHMEIYDVTDKDNKPTGLKGWRIKVGDDIVATDGNQGYTNERDLLHSLFLIFLGTWDESFLDLYEKWQSYAGEDAYDVPPEAQHGVPVRQADDHPEVFRDVPNGGEE